MGALRPALAWVAAAHLAACAPPTAATAVAGQVVVRFAPDATEAQRAAARAAAGAQGPLALGPAAERWTVADAAAAIAAAEARPGVAFAHPNHRRRLLAAAPPRLGLLQAPGVDPLREGQWHLEAARFPQAWARGRGAGVVVAVLDSGVDPAHPDLAANLLPGIDELAATGQTDLYAGEDYAGRDAVGHGTHVIGLIAAAAGNGLGGDGAAPEAKVLPIKVTNHSEFSDDATIAKGIADAIAGGAQVMNLSIGGPQPSPLLLEALNDAFRVGVVAVIASGNDGGDVNYPAVYPGVVAVGATVQDGRIAGYSCGGSGLVLVAPGGGNQRQPGEGPSLISTVPTYAVAGQHDRLGVGYGGNSGTSMAAPLVSAAAALIRAAHPGLSPAQVRTRLAATARDGGEPGWDPGFGYGNLDAEAAVTAP